MRKHSVAVVALSLLLLSSCGKKAAAPVVVAPPKPPIPGGPRPSAPLGLYITYFLGGGGISPSLSALSGIDAQVKLHIPYNPLKNSDTYALLEEYGNILQINIPDLLNRSTDRPTTLTQYTDALANITERAKLASTDLQTHADDLHKQGQTQRTTLSTAQRQSNDAFGKGDYATAGALQQEINDAQAKVAQTDSEEKESRDLLSTFKKLIDIAGKRLAAIDENRAVLIAGLKVVEIPGIENLNILQKNGQTKTNSLYPTK